MFRTRLLNSVCFAPEMGTGGGGGNQPQNQNNQNQNNGNNQPGNNQQQQNGGNNSSDFDLNGGNIWADEPPNDGNRQQRNDGNNNSSQQQQVDPNAQFDAYIKAQKFDFTLTPEAIENFVQKGDAAGLSEALNDTLRGTVKKVLTDTARMVQNAREGMRQEFQQLSQQTVSTHENVRTLERIVPLAKNPNMQPVAQAAFQKFMQKGMDAESAAKRVGAFFNSIRNAKPGDLGLDSVPPRGNGGNNRGSNFAANNQADDDMDWLQFAEGNL